MEKDRKQDKLRNKSPSTMSNATSSSSPVQPAAAGSSGSLETTNNVVKAIGNILKAQTGEPLSNEKISSLLLANMTTLVQQGKLTQSQIIQVDDQSLFLWNYFSDLLLS